MRIHTRAGLTDVVRAAHLAGASIDVTSHGSRKRPGAFEVKLRGASRRRPNFYNGDGQFAATWDQWGVFFANLYAVDPEALCGSTYSNDFHFHQKTFWRFVGGAMPSDAHGDHTFRWAGVPREQECTKCSARQSW